ncbi:MAG: peptidoglycan DD-metalloendopeptidase family protein [Candidatus Krumholzibacteria bacterium]|nr:peptidoglycan DD-metalloendopeptidase family protein [Candidatus Krumholzibacteria bacterium]
MTPRADSQTERMGAPLNTPEHTPESKNRPSLGFSRWGLPAMAIFGLSLMVWGIAVLTPSENPVVREDGRGGPAEFSTQQGLAQVGQLDLSRHSPYQGSLVRSTEAYLTSGELGPVFRPDVGPVEMKIGRGQTFYEALAARGIAHEDIMTVVKGTKEFRDLRNVKSGEVFRIHITPDGGLKSLGYDLDEESHVTWLREGDNYSRQDGTYPVQRMLKGISGTINSSLYASLQKINAPLSLAPKMNDIMGWDIDFKRDLRQGDTFRILYEEVWKDDRLVRTGSIQAIEMVNKGQEHTAYLFAEGDRPRYYSNEGRNMQKQLSRAPLNYSRISSKYSHRRFHPVLKRWMPHLGVDYAAPLGTPVRAGGDGVVLTATHKKGNGRYIQICHTNSQYETYYLHLSKYAKGIKKGTKVSQGQVIGYVGATGYATGPHLDYRVKRRGQFVNPRTLKLPAAAPVSADLRPRFDALAERYTEALNAIPADTSVAMAPIQLVDPPAWDQATYAQIEVPAMVRAAN